jgi:hypothetical protein
MWQRRGSKNVIFLVLRLLKSFPDNRRNTLAKHSINSAIETPTILARTRII